MGIILEMGCASTIEVALGSGVAETSRAKASQPLNHRGQVGLEGTRAATASKNRPNNAGGITDANSGKIMTQDTGALCGRAGSVERLTFVVVMVQVGVCWRWLKLKIGPSGSRRVAGGSQDSVGGERGPFQWQRHQQQQQAERRWSERGREAGAASGRED